MSIIVQVFKGLNIVTNKVTDREQVEVPHHMISYVEKPWIRHTVTQFKDKALPIVRYFFSYNHISLIISHVF